MKSCEAPRHIGPIGPAGDGLQNLDFSGMIRGSAAPARKRQASKADAPHDEIIQRGIEAIDLAAECLKLAVHRQREAHQAPLKKEPLSMALNTLS